MAIVDSELVMLKSKVIDDTSANGGLMDNTAVVTTGVVNNVWPSVFKAERLAGSTKYRKTFLKVANDSDETLFNTQIWMDQITQGDDWVTLFLGTQTDVQSDIGGTEDHYGCGTLQANVAAGAGSIVVTVENAVLATGAADEIFRDGDTIRITNKDTPSSVTGTEEVHVINGVPTVSGLDITITLTSTLANAYNVSDNTYGTRVMSVLEPGDIEASFSSFVDTTAGDGAYDDASYPVLLDNIGTINQTVTITFTSATTFTAASNVAGVTLTGGTKGVLYAPNNPTFTKPYFTLEAGGWSGTWASGDTIVFNTVPASDAIWQKRTVPAGAGTLTGNKAIVVFSGESA
jgi:hypothetical protein